MINFWKKYKQKKELRKKLEKAKSIQIGDVKAGKKLTIKY